MTRESRNAGLDALRGVAVALVLVHHAFLDGFPLGGLVGVLIFFTLSGYLITGVLLRSINNSGRVDYGRFYRNRALRLLPALGLMLLVVAAITAVIDPLGDRTNLPRGLLVAATYTADLPIDQGLRTIAHLWTLSVEEQFYLLWPVVLALGVKTGRLRQFVLVAAAASIAVCAVSVLLVTDDDGLYERPTTWAVTIVVGAAARIHRERLVAAAAGRAATVSAWAGLVVLVGFGVVGDRLPVGLVYVAGGPVIAAMSVVLVLVAERQVDAQGWAQPWVRLGTISYAAYLWNWPITLWVDAAGWPQPVAALAGLLLTVAAAWLSWWLVEDRVAAWREKIDARPMEVTRGA